MKETDVNDPCPICGEDHEAVEQDFLAPDLGGEAG
jgi:hypothetical protein